MLNLRLRGYSGLLLNLVKKLLYRVQVVASRRLFTIVIIIIIVHSLLLYLARLPLLRHLREECLRVLEGSGDRV